MTDEAATQGRQPRAEEVAKSRRDRFEGIAGEAAMRRFGLPDAFLDQSKFIYRSVADDKTRLMELTQHDDYDFVTAEGAISTDRGAKGVVRYQSGTNVDGSPQYTYLLRKPKRFADEHRARAIAKIDAEEQARLKQTPEDAPDKSYTPKR